MGRTNAKKQNNTRGVITSQEPNIADSSDGSTRIFSDIVNQDVNKYANVLSDMKNYTFSSYLTPDERAKFFGEGERDNEKIWKHVQANNEVAKSYHDATIGNLKKSNYGQEVNEIISDIKALNKTSDFKINPMRLKTLKTTANAIAKSKPENLRFRVYPETYEQDRLAVQSRNYATLAYAERNLARINENLNFALRNKYVNESQIAPIQAKIKSALGKVSTSTNAYTTLLRNKSLRALNAHERTPLARKQYDDFVFGDYANDSFLTTGALD